MKEVAGVSTDDLVSSLLESVTPVSSSLPTSSSATPTTSSSSATDSTTPSFTLALLSATTSYSASSSTDGDTESPLTTEAPEPIGSMTPGPAPTSEDPYDSTAKALKKTSGDGRSTAGLSIGISLGVVVVVIAALFFMRSRRSKAQKEYESTATPAIGSTPMTLPSDRGFKRERELGMPEMSIELAPGELGTSKGFDMSYPSSTRSSVVSQQFNLSLASSDSGLFDTKGGVSPTRSNHKVTSYSYQYRESEEKGNGNNSAGSTTFHLTGLIGNGATASGRGPSNIARSRKLSAPDEYAELITATNAQAHVYMSGHDPSFQGSYRNVAHSQNEMNTSMGPDGDNYSFIAPLPSKMPSSRVPKRLPLANGRASEESMGPDSPVVGRDNRTNSVYDTLPNLSGEKMSAPSRHFVEKRLSNASFMSQSSLSPASMRDSMTTSACSSAELPSMPLLQQLSNTTDSDYGQDVSSERASTESTDSANTARSGSLIALNLDAKDGSEIAI